MGLNNSDNERKIPLNQVEQKPSETLPEHVLKGVRKSFEAGLLWSADDGDETGEENNIEYPSPLTDKERQEAVQEILDSKERGDAQVLSLANALGALSNGGLYTVDENTHIPSSYLDEIRNILPNNIKAGSLLDLVSYIQNRDLMSGTSGLKLEWFDENSLRYWTLDTNEEGVMLNNKTNKVIIEALIYSVQSQTPLNGGKIQVPYALKDERFTQPNRSSRHQFKPIGPVQPRVEADDTPTVLVSAGEGGDKSKEKKGWFGNLWRRITGR